ncbi:MAG: endolytic transglycosylase MltG [Oscillospiraceae bacterium]|nr:endolytic transglycosylase MltG [Oscillospiraceae bacterium]
MPDDIEKINEIFRTHDEQGKPDTAPEPQEPDAGRKKTPLKAVDHLMIDSTGSETRNYTGDAESERDYRPVRQSHESRSGCLGGIMYFTFIVCVSLVLACLAWMAASDMLALNKDDFTAVVTLPSSIFQSETVDRIDENGRKTGTKRITHADMDYVADVLKDAGLIEYKWLFTMFCKISTADEKVSPGEYELRSTFDYRALIQNMRAGSASTVTVDVTIPEGFKMHQLFLRLEENGVCGYNELMEAAEDTEYNYDFLAESEGEGAYRLEGYLFPDTYEFYVGMQASSAINKLLDNYNRKITDEMEARVEELDMTMYDILKVASLIEKEAANDEERMLIASVIYNRLNADMVLGIDASVLYPYNDHEGAPTATMLSADDPYNSRIKLGLPPTPICNPGLNAINAALWPADTGYYYYALDTASGTHRFFTNETEFNNFVATQDYS